MGDKRSANWIEDRPSTSAHPAEERERMIALIMERKGVTREEAEEALRRAETEALRMRDA
jgi:hypothetical protein